MKRYGFVCLFGMNLIENKDSACIYAQNNGKTAVFARKNKFRIAGGLPIIRGITFLFYGLYLFFINMVRNTNVKQNKITKKTSESLNLKPNTAFLFLTIIFAFLIAILFFGILPVKLSFYLTNLNYNMFLKRFVIALIKVALIYLVFLSVRPISTFRQLYRLNGALNIYIKNVADFSIDNKQDKTSYHYSLNFLNYLVCSFMLCSVILSMIGFTMSTWYNPLLNLLITFTVFALNFELLKICANCKSKFVKSIFIPIQFLTTARPSETELKLMQVGQQELLLMKNRKRKYTNNLKKNEMISMSDAILEAKTILQEKGKYDKTDVEYALCEILDKSVPAVKLTNYLSNEQYKKFISVIQKRAEGMPMTKIFGKAHFYGYDFIVTKDVLSPRQETEILVEQTLKLVKPKSKILDLCTGSGAIAISIAKKCNNKITASDISKDALNVAIKNASQLNANVNFVESNLFEKLKKDKFDIIVSNPPYIKTSDLKTLDEEVIKYDPKISLDGGDLGLDFYEKIIAQAPRHLVKKGYLLFEIGINQAEDIKNLLQNNFENIRIVKDYNKIDRVIIANLK